MGKLIFGSVVYLTIDKYQRTKNKKVVKVDEDVPVMRYKVMDDDETIPVDEVMDDVMDDDETVPVDEVDGGGVSPEEEAKAGARKDGGAKDEAAEPVTN